MVVATDASWKTFGAIGESSTLTCPGCTRELSHLLPHDAFAYVTAGRQEVITPVSLVMRPGTRGGFDGAAVHVPVGWYAVGDQNGERGALLGFGE
jgi:hypothetical protein